MADAFVGLMREEGGKGDCVYVAACPIFKRIGRDDISESYKARYCRALFADCARFSTRERGEIPPLDLLPDGSRLKDE